MAIHGALTNAAIWYGSVDLSGTANNVAFQATVEDKETTTFASAGAKTRTGGLTDSMLDVDGYADFAAGGEDETLWSAFTTNTHVCSVSASGTDGSIGFMFSALDLSYQLGGAVGEVLPYKAHLGGRDQYGPVRGSVLMPKSSLSGTGFTNGTATQLGAVSATQRVYASLHVFSEASGTSPTLDCIIRSSAASDMSSPTTRISFTQTAGAGTVSDQFSSAAGAITDTYWQARFSVGAGAGTPVYSVAVLVGIQ